MWLKKAIKQNKHNCLLKEQLDDFQPENKQFYLHRFDELLDKATEEWKHDSELSITENQKFNCELCGQPITYPYKIKNIRNQKELIVGSTCITNYKNITDVSGKTFEEIKKEKEQMKIRHENEIKIESLSPNIISNFSKIKNFTKKNSNFLTFDLTMELNDFLNDGITKYENYIAKKKIKKKELDELIVLHNKAITLLNKLNDYIKFCQTDIMGLNTLVCDWCNRFSNQNVKKLLMEDGKITERTIGDIKEDNFIKKVLLKYEELLNKNNLNFSDKNLIGNTFAIELPDARKLVLNVNSSKFINKYRDYIFNGKNYNISYNDMINISNITEDKSLNNALMYIFEKTKLPRNFDVLINDTQINELAIQYNRDKIYVLNYRHFIQQFKSLIFKETITKEDSNSIEDYIFNKSKKYTYDDYRDHLKPYHIYL